MLGPLCVGAAVFRLESWQPGDGGGAPDLWDMLSTGVCRKANDKRRRVAIEDSKKLKLANSSATHHPLTHLERGVLSFLACRAADAGGPFRPESDHALLEALTASLEPHAWYAGDPRPIPVGQSPEQIGIAANGVARAMSEAGVHLVALRCRVVGERAFNQVVEEAGTKAAATELALGSYLRGIWDKWAGDINRPEGGPRVVCDRQGGRTDYAPVLARLLPGCEVTVLEESARCCRYRLDAAGGAEQRAQMTVMFMPEAESRHLPIALASMTAKYVRELAMARFNSHWCGLCPELKPTAGYSLDARRWLRDATKAGLVGSDERRELIRRA